MINPYVESLIDYARSFRGVPYVYAGNNPFISLDCSGYLCVVLRKPGIVGLHEDLSAQGLHDKLVGLKALPVNVRQRKFPAGTILFYGKSVASVTHVAMALDWYSAIESGGGDSKTKEADKSATSFGSGVREVSVSFRSDLVAALLPKYPWDEEFG